MAVSPEHGFLLTHQVYQVPPCAARSWALHGWAACPGAEGPPWGHVLSAGQSRRHKVESCPWMTSSISVCHFAEFLVK